MLWPRAKPRTARTGPDVTCNAAHGRSAPQSGTGYGAGDRGLGRALPRGPCRRGGLISPTPARIGVSLLAIWLASRPPSRARPLGYPNATNIAALVNAGWLLVLNIAIAAAAIQRLAEGTRRVEGLPVLIVSGIAAAVERRSGRSSSTATRREDDDGEEDPEREGGPARHSRGRRGRRRGSRQRRCHPRRRRLVLGLDPAVALLIAVIIGYHAQKLVRKVIAAIRA